MVLQLDIVDTVHCPINPDEKDPNACNNKARIKILNTFIFVYFFENTLSVKC